MSRGSRVVPGRRAARLARLVALAIVTLALAGCGDKEQRAAQARAREESDLRARSQALIENGNQAFRAGDYSLAARRYASAVVIDDQDPAAFYGLGMALAKLGKDEDARAMYARARLLVRTAQERGDSLTRR